MDLWQQNLLVVTYQLVVRQLPRGFVGQQEARRAGTDMDDFEPPRLRMVLRKDLVVVGDFGNHLVYRLETRESKRQRRGPVGVE